MDFHEAVEQATGIWASQGFDAAEHAQSIMHGFAESAADPREKGLALAYAADYAYRRGHIKNAISWFWQADDLLNDPVDRLTLFATFGNAVTQMRAHAEVDAVAQRLHSALEACNGMGIPGLAFGTAALAELLVMQGRLDVALAYANQAVVIANSLNVARAEAYSSLKTVLEKMGRYEEAMDALEMAMSYMSAGHCLMEARAEYSRLALLLGDVVTAKQYLCHAVTLADIRDRQIIAKVLRVMADLIRHDPEMAIALNLRLAAYLENSCVSKEVAS